MTEKLDVSSPAPILTRPLEETTSTLRLDHAGNGLPRVSIASGSSNRPSTNGMAVSATGTPRLPYWSIPIPTRKVAPAAMNRPIYVANASALPRHSVRYCSLIQVQYTAKLPPPIPTKKRPVTNVTRACAGR